LEKKRLYEKGEVRAVNSTRQTGLNKFVDKTARKPSGWFAKRMYSNPRGHYKSFRWTLDKLQLEPDDIFLEIGCGGGVLLNMALEIIKHARAIDHSADMVQIAKEKNQKAVSEGRVEIVQGNAESLPWDDNSLEGDYLQDSIGEGYDLIFASSTLSFAGHDMDSLMKKIYNALNPGGVFINVLKPTHGQILLFKIRRNFVLGFGDMCKTHI